MTTNNQNKTNQNKINQTLVEKYFPKTWDDIKLPIKIKTLLTTIKDQTGYRLLLHSSPGTGKCLGKDTLVLMYDGSKKKVQDIQVGEQLMGWDSKPRNVLSTCSGREELIKIIPTNGEPWVCNKSHILSVIESEAWRNYKNGEKPPADSIEDVNVLNSFIFKENHTKKLFRVPLDFERQDISINPYTLGFWLGSGECTALLGGLNEIDYPKSNIPKEYLFNSRDIRLQLFVGIIDSVGGSGECSHIVTTKFDSLKNDVEFLVRSLGYDITVKKELDKTINKEYWRLLISDDFDLNKNSLVFGFKTESLGEGDYYGFEIDGDRRFMLGDFTVTHNTTTARLLADRTKNDVMYLSGSNDFKIDTFRQKVLKFSSGISATGKGKIVIIDECENIRDNLQDAFKITLDQAKSTSFIFITNELEKVNEAIRSRCTQLEYDFSGDNLEEQQKNFVKFAVEICKTENIEYENAGIKQLYIRLFPDFRHLIVSLQRIKDSGEKVTESVVKSNSENGKQNIKLYSLVMDGSIIGKELYEEASKMKGKERECLISFGEPFFQYLNDQNKYDTTLQAAIIVAKYSEMFVTSINKFVTLLSCINELKTLFR